MAKPKRPTEVGPAGERVAANLAAIRGDRGMNQAELAARLNEVGRPMSAPVVSKTEKLDRRVDVDDLMAFAVALGTTPNRLLLAHFTDLSQEIDLAPGVRVSMLDAWRWAAGDIPLSFALDPFQEADIDEVARKFVRENAPHENALDISFTKEIGELRLHPELMRQAKALVQSAIDEGVSPWVLHAAITLFGFATEGFDSEKLLEEES